MNIWEKNGINERDTKPRNRVSELQHGVDALELAVADGAENTADLADAIADLSSIVSELMEG